jgi:hypothetical protein
VNFTEVGHFASRLEAETIGHALDQHSIPFLVQSEDVGIFGPGHCGRTPGGATLLVREEDLERVRELMSCLVPLEERELS